MVLSFIGSYFVLVIAAGALFYVALTDLKEFKISNELIWVLTGLYVLFALLWVGLDCALVFAILLLIFVGIHTGVAKLGWVKVQGVGKDKRIPFAPSIAAALIGTFMSGCLRPLAVVGASS